MIPIIDYLDGIELKGFVIIIDQDVLRFEVAMCEALLVDQVDALQYLAE